MGGSSKFYQGGPDFLGGYGHQKHILQRAVRASVEEQLDPRGPGVHLLLEGGPYQNL